MDEDRLFTLEEAAAACGMDVLVVRRYAELGLVAPAGGYTAEQLAELRRARRLASDLDLDHAAVAIILRMRRRILALQAEMRRLERELRAAHRPSGLGGWTEAEWYDDTPPR
jgi:DNA-binding transcriptional MerR regulator